MKESKVNLYEQVTGKIINMLKEHQTTWDKPWVQLDTSGMKAHNALSKNVYRGMNQLLLGFITHQKNYAKNGWLTFKQIRELRGQVIKGEQSSSLYYWNFIFIDHDGNKVDTKKITCWSNEQLKEAKIKKKPLLRYFKVFNIFQTKNLPNEYYKIDPITQPQELEKDIKAEQLIKSTNAEIIYRGSDKACYYPIDDVITLPLRQQFKGQDGALN